MHSFHVPSSFSLFCSCFLIPFLLSLRFASLVTRNHSSTSLPSLLLIYPSRLPIPHDPARSSFVLSFCWSEGKESGTREVEGRGSGRALFLRLLAWRECLYLSQIALVTSLEEAKNLHFFSALSVPFPGRHRLPEKEASSKGGESASPLPSFPRTVTRSLSSPSSLQANT